MDVLHVALGPVLAHWPAGVVLRCALQGDVVVEAEASVLDESDLTSARLDAHRPIPDERAARRCDQVADLLALAGWVHGQSCAVRCRDALLDDPDAASGAAALDGLERRVRRARLLRWSLRRIGELGRGDEGRQTPPNLQGDVYDRLLQLIERARAELAGEDAHEASLPELLAIAQRLVVGLDLAAARLVVASLAIDTLTASVVSERATTGEPGA